ncbi:MAG TPA: hypothetical protein PLN21_20970 [Gemmatales bacterium]|nr:hypothetical protein [Gemmatales bacterium]
MSTLTLRKNAKALIDTLSPAQLRAASEFLAFVKSRELNPATRELLNISDFEASFVRGMKDIKAGRTKPWRQVRSDV